jgi:multiple sugar transport system ATP-binding protein
MNLMPATLAGDAAEVGSLRVPLTSAQRAELTSERVVVGVRPEGFAIGTTGGLDATVDLVEELGSECYLYCTAPGVADRELDKLKNQTPVKIDDAYFGEVKPSAN